MSDPLCDAAADYLNLGLSVIALTGKTPNVSIHRRGLHDCISGPVDTPEDWALICRVFLHPDTTGVGILTSFPYVVVDIDGEEGAQQFQHLVYHDTFGEPRWVAKTGRGLHFWFATTVPTGSIKLGPKLDLKGDGGYVAAPPSRHPDGGFYEWLRPPGSEAPTELPESIQRIIEDHNYDRLMAMEAKSLRRNAWGPRWTPGDTVFYAQPGYDAVIAAVRAAQEGNRNHVLYWAAMTLAEEGADEHQFDLLAEAALAVGLEREETRRTLRGARQSR